MRNAVKLALALDATEDIDAVLQDLDRVKENGCRRSPREINDTSDLFSAFPLGTLPLTHPPADSTTKAAASQDPRPSPGTRGLNPGRWIDRRPIADANSSNVLRPAVRRSITRRNVVRRHDEGSVRMLPISAQATPPERKRAVAGTRRKTCHLSSRAGL
jgi:hypothetical protein